MGLIKHIALVLQPAVYCSLDQSGPEQSRQKLAVAMITGCHCKWMPERKRRRNQTVLTVFHPFFVQQLQGVLIQPCNDGWDTELYFFNYKLFLLLYSFQYSCFTETLRAKVTLRNCMLFTPTTKLPKQTCQDEVWLYIFAMFEMFSNLSKLQYRAVTVKYRILYKVMMSFFFLTQNNYHSS